MKLLIDIPEEDYKYIRNNGSIYFTHVHNIINGIIYGKVMKNQGRLIDADELNRTLDRWWIETENEPQTIISVYYDILHKIHDARTIIEGEED